MELIQEYSTAFTILFLAVAALIIRLIVWYAHVNSDRDKFKEFMTDVKDKLDKIYDHLIGRQPYIGASPLRLTEMGERISADIKAKDIAETLSVKLGPKTKNMTDYDIQEYAREYVLNTFKPDSEKLIAISDCAFQEGITVDQVRGVIGIELRDKLIEMKRSQ